MTFFTNNHYCQICNKTQSDNFIILNCNHTFHINCLANFHHGPTDGSLHKLNCAYCQCHIDDLELVYLHNKFCKNVTVNIINMNENIKKLQTKIKKFQEAIIETEYQYKRSNFILESI